MRKRISLKTRRPGITRAECRTYYEQHHVPLGLGFIEHFQWQRYVRNHVCETSSASVPFDCVTEFWVADEADDDALARFIASDAFTVLDLDDRHFLDTERRFSGDFEEYPIAVARTGSRSQEAPQAPSIKYLLFWLAGDEPLDSQLDRSHHLVGALGDGVRRASLDRLRGPTPPAAPFDTLLWIEASEAIATPVPDWKPREGGFGWTRVEPIETPPDKLYRPRE